MSETKIALPRTAAELESMSAADINAAIAELRRLQRESLPIKPRIARFGICGGALGGGLFGSTHRLEMSMEDGFAIDAKNLHDDFERVGRDMWIGVLQHAQNSKNA